MFSIDFQLLAHVKNFRLLTPRQSSFHQLRLSVYQQSLIKNKKPQQLIPYLILTPQQQQGTNINVSQSINQSLYRNDTINIQGNTIFNKYTGLELLMKQPHIQMSNSPQQQPQINQNQTYNRVSSLDVQYNNNYSKNLQLGEIDLENNSFLTKPFLVQRVDYAIGLDEAVVFKGSVEFGVDEMLEIISKQQEQRKKSQQQLQQISKQKLNSKLLINSGHNSNSTFTSYKQSSKQINSPFSNILSSLYVSCELFLVSSYSTEPIGEWGGYTLTDEGTVLLPVSFFSYNSSYSLVEITFLWSKVTYISQGKQSDFNNRKGGEQQINKIIQYLQTKYQHLSSTVLKLPKQYSITINNNSNNKLSEKKNTPLQQRLLSKLDQFNEKTYQLWRTYQQFIQNTIRSKGRLKVISNALNDQKLSKHQQALNFYHWKHHIKVNQSSTTTNDIYNHLSMLKSSQTVDQQLVFYPFAQHQRVVKLSNDDMSKIEKINSLSLSLSSKHKQMMMKTNLTQQQQQNKKLHLLIFVHGYQASSYDMQNLACFLKYKNPQRIRTFISSCNQSRTQQPIQESGHRLAIQIKNYINNKFQHDKQDVEISFVCHSMGGLIVRAALKYLQLYKNKFRTYLSLCSPHLGYLYHSSTLIKTSLWVLNQVKKDPSMIELSMQDNPVLEKTYLYQLSKRTQLQWFKYPIFIGSRQDQYVPYWSALVQDKQFYFETNDAKIYKQLYKQLTESIQHKIIRLQTVYQDKINDISSFVGRTAHIRILNCIEVMEIIYLLVQGAF